VKTAEDYVRDIEEAEFCLINDPLELLRKYIRLLYDQMDIPMAMTVSFMFGKRHPDAAAKAEEANKNEDSYYENE